MILIDETYFTGDLSLPNIPVHIQEEYGVKEALQTVGENNLNSYANKYVIDYLVRLFGRELTAEFLLGLTKPEPVQIWIDLKNKLLISFTGYKASPLANYVYYRLMRDAVTKTTQAGEADPDFDEAKNAGNGMKLVRAWNEMVEMTFNIHNWFFDNIDLYEKYIGDHTGRKVCSITQSINTFNI